MRRLATLLCVIVLSACSDGAKAPPSAPTPAVPQTPAPVAVPAPPPKPAAPRVARAKPPAKAPPDTCGARDLQTLVGRPRSEIPVAVDPSARRVTCATCPMTMDFRPERLNILFDAETGLVKEVKCG